MKKIGIIVFKYPLGVSPYIINSAILLAREGYKVHIFIDKPNFDRSRINFTDPNIILHLIQDKHNSGIWNRRIWIFRNGEFKTATIGTIYRYIYPRFMILIHMYLMFNRDYLSSFGGKLHHYTKYIFEDIFEFYKRTLEYIDDDYACIIGVEPKGLIAASFLSIEKKIPVIYFNMELFLENECKTSYEKFLKCVERECNKRSYITLIADERRAKYLINDNNIPIEKIVCVPVSALGETYQKKSDYLYKILGISKDKKIILYAGNIIEWSLSLEIAKAAQKWDDNMVLVLHTWKPNLDKDPYINQIRDLTKNKKVYLSLNPVEYESLPELLSSADIGLVFYKNLGKNFYETGSSSNKLAQYLQVGLPVITIDYPSFREVIEKYKCGECAKSPEEIETLVKKIFLNYDAYRNNSFKCYMENYEFSKHFKIVIDKIKSILSTQCNK